MPPGHRLRGLQMGKARHDPVRPRLGLREEGLHQPGKPKDGLIALVAHPKPEIDGHLIVPAARGVQALACVPDQLGQAGLDVQVDILQLDPESELSRLDL